MSRAVVRQMQEDRQLGNFTHENYDTRVARLREMGAANWEQPPLPISPCIRLKSTGEIHEWSQFFADRPDLCENCDEHGNTDERAWRGRKPKGMDASGAYVNIYASTQPAEEVKVEAEPTPAEQRPELEAPQGLMFFFEDFESSNDVPQVGMATATLGVASNFSQDYTDTTTVKAALPISNRQSNVTVSEAIQQAFSTRAYV